MNIGDRVRVIEQVWKHQDYPFIPDLTGKEGVILDIVPVKGDTPVVKVKFDQKFQVGVLPQGVHAFDYLPDDWEEADEYSLTAEELEVL